MTESSEAFARGHTDPVKSRARALDSKATAFDNPGQDSVIDHIPHSERVYRASFLGRVRAQSGDTWSESLIVLFAGRNETMGSVWRGRRTRLCERDVRKETMALPLRDAWMILRSQVMRLVAHEHHVSCARIDVRRLLPEGHGHPAATDDDAPQPLCLRLCA